MSLQFIENKQINGHLNQKLYPLIFLNKKRESTEEIYGKDKNNSEKYPEELKFLNEHPEEEESIKEEIYGPFKKENLHFQDEEETNSYDRYLIKPEIKETFKVINPNFLLFHKANVNLEEIFETKYDFSIRKRSKERLPNYKQKHYIRVIMKRRFFNTYLLDALNELVREAGYKNSFAKLPQSFVRNVEKLFNNRMMKKTLGQILKEKETYALEKKTNYINNSTLVKQIEKEGNIKLNLILETKISRFFEEYFESKEFLVKEIERLKNSKTGKVKDNYYFWKLIYLTKKFPEFCFNEQI